jgi:hypothetical protein
MRLPLLLTLLAGCGPVHFADPNPPQLFHSRVDYSTTAQAEPLLWMPLIDLFDESGTGCSDAQSWVLQAIRGAMRSIDAGSVELAGALVSKDCDQQAGRAVDAVALQQQIDAAQAALPAAHLRVIFVYANNIALPVPDAVAQGLSRLRPHGFLWTLAHAPVSTQVGGDQTRDWTYLHDGALQGALTTLLAPSFPLQSDRGADSGPRPILGADDLPRARAVKICSATASISFADFPGNGTAIPVDPAQPPRFRVQFVPQLAVPKGQFAPQHASFEVEGCSAGCGGYFTRAPGDLVRWDRTRGCFLEAR